MVSLVYQFTKLEVGSKEIALLKLSISSNWFFLAFACLLMPLNWLTECGKWYLTMRVSYSISWRTCIKCVLMGVSVSLVTPNRIGEYFGRVAGVNPDQRGAGILTTLLGGFAQNLITWTAGILAALFLFNEQIEFSSYFNTSYSLLVILLIVIGFVVFFKISLVKKVFIYLSRKFKPLKSYVDVFEVLEQQNSKILLKLLVLSACRYLLYMSQYVLLLYFLGIECSLPYAFAGVAFIFFIQASIPLPAGLGLIMRGNVSLLVWGTLCSASMVGVVASYLLFIINFSLTAFLGVYFFFKSDISFKQIKHVENSH